MHTRSTLTALGLLATLTFGLGVAPAQAHSSVSFGINIGPGHHHPHGYVHYHGGRACTIRHRYRNEWPYYYNPWLGFWPYAPPPPVVFADDCRWYRGRWHCY